MNDLLYVIPANSTKEDIIATLKQHPENQIRILSWY